jgi:hypothetical protein
VTGSASNGGPGERQASSGGDSGQIPHLGDFFFLGTACAISVVGGGAIGYGLDSWLGTTPWLIFAGLAFGIVTAVLLCVRSLRNIT